MSRVSRVTTTCYGPEQIKKTHIFPILSHTLPYILHLGDLGYMTTLRSEVGRHSLQEKILTRNINYIKYIDSKDPQALVKQSANYEILYVDKRNSLYSILKKYEQNLTNQTNDNEGIRKLSKPKLCKITTAGFDVLWKTQVNSFPKADTYKLFKNSEICELSH